MQFSYEASSNVCTTVRTSVDLSTTVCIIVHCFTSLLLIMAYHLLGLPCLSLTFNTFCSSGLLRTDNF